MSSLLSSHPSILKRKEETRRIKKGKERKGKERKGKERKGKEGYAFWRQLNEKPSIIPGCPGSALLTLGQLHVQPYQLYKHVRLVGWT